MHKVIEMNGAVVTTVDPRVMREQVEKAIELSGEVSALSEQVAALYAAERDAYHVWQTAQASLEEMLNAEVADADYVASTEKTGPLAGIARTSDAYKVAVKKFRAELLAGSFRHEATVVNQFENDYREASIAYEQAKVRLGGLKTVSDLQVAILRALAG